MRTGTNANVITKAPVVQIVFALLIFFGVGGNFIALVASRSQELQILLKDRIDFIFTR